MAGSYKSPKNRMREGVFGVQAGEGALWGECSCWGCLPWGRVLETPLSAALLLSCLLGKGSDFYTPFLSPSPLFVCDVDYRGVRGVEFRVSFNACVNPVLVEAAE